MDDFVGLDIVSLRKILCQTIIESCGRDLRLGGCRVHTLMRVLTEIVTM